MKFKPKKSLGQNFLIDQNITSSIVEIGKINTDDTVLEVGPGTGNLTKEILSKNPKKLILIEKDKKLSENLVNKFGNKIELINEDILKINEKSLTKDKIIIFGNLPYNISTQILAKWIKTENIELLCKKFILMFQKEVADRIVAKTNSSNYGRLSILANWRMNVKKIQDINPNSFYPPPKVKSSVIFMEPKTKFFKIKNSENLEKITQVFFNQRRKMVKKPLNKLFKNVNDICNKIDIKLNERPQNITPEQYFLLCKEFEDLT